MATTLSPLKRRDIRIERLYITGERQRQPARLPYTRDLLLSQDPASDADRAWAMMDIQADQVRKAPSDEPIQKALDFYDAKLRPSFEPQHNGEYVAIHADTKDYIVELRPGKAFRALRAKHPRGPIVLHYIGFASPGLKERLRGERPH